VILKKKNHNKFEEIKTLENIKIIKIYSGFYHSFALSNTGIIYGWGNNVFGQLGHDWDNKSRNLPEKIEYFNDKHIIDVICGSNHSFFTSTNGKIYSCGLNGSGQLGLGKTKYNYYSSPQEITFFNNKDIIRLSTGYSHSLSLSKFGDVYSWGYNNSGRLGHGDNKHRNQPELIKYFNNKEIIQVCLWLVFFNCFIKIWNYF